jgi:hypothetical protein
MWMTTTGKKISAITDLTFPGISASAGAEEETSTKTKNRTRRLMGKGMFQHQRHNAE